MHPSLSSEEEDGADVEAGTNDGKTDEIAAPTGATNGEPAVAVAAEIVDTTDCGDDDDDENDDGDNDRTGSIHGTIGDRSADDDPSRRPLVEIQHLKRRIRNVREISIQTSRDAIASDLTKYRNNVLNATKNCVHEWRSIARHYRTTHQNDGDDNENHDDGIANDDINDNDTAISSALRKETGLVVFQLIQLTVQSGPLTGGKPGYFKRCGAEVAGTVLEFLEEVVPGHDGLGVDCMGFTPKQMDAMRQWMRNAAKAVENGKPPSKSVNKHFVKGKSKKSKKKK